MAIALAWFYLKRQTPQLKITGKIIVQKDAKNDIVNESLFGSSSPFLSSDLSLVNEIEILRSPKLMERVIEAEDVFITYFSESRFVTKELHDDSPVRLVLSDSSSSLINKWIEVLPTQSQKFVALLTKYDPISDKRILLDTLRGEFGKDSYFEQEAFKLYKVNVLTQAVTIRLDHPNALAPAYAGRLDIVSVPQSEVLSISMVDNIPQRSIKILTELIDVYNQEVLDNKNRSIRQRLAFIDDRLKIIADELFEVEKDLEDFKRDKEVPLALSTTALTFLERVNDTDQAISEIDLQKSLLDGIEEELNKQAGQDDDLLIIDFSIDGQVPEVIATYNRLVTQRKALLVSATAGNPQVRILDDQIESTRRNLVGWIQFKKDELDREKKYMEQRAASLANRISSIPTDEREMLQIVRQQAIKETLFTFLLQRREETAMTLASEVSNARIISDPVFEAQISPNKRFVYLMFLFFGMSVPTLAFFLKNYFDDKIYSKQDITQNTSAPYLASINMAKEEDIDNKNFNTRSVTAEMFRLLRSNLRFMATDSTEKVILVTSSSSGEGKTFVSFNLGMSLALSGKSVVLLGMDMRKPRLTSFITGQKSQRGISNYLVGAEEDLNAITYKVPGHENFAFIGSGPVPPNPAELMIGERCGEMFDILRQKYDYIIADTSPIGLVADAYSLERYVDITLFITRFSITRKSDLQIVEDLFVNKKLPKPAIVFNGVKTRTGYGSNSYSYRYGAYSQDQKKGFWSRLRS